MTPLPWSPPATKDTSPTSKDTGPSSTLSPEHPRGPQHVENLSSPETEMSPEAQGRKGRSAKKGKSPMTSTKYSVYTDGNMSEKQIAEYHAEVELKEWHKKSGSSVTETDRRRKKLHVNLQVMQDGVSPMMAMIRNSACLMEDEECNTKRGSLPGAELTFCFLIGDLMHVWVL